MISINFLFCCGTLELKLYQRPLKISTNLFGNNCVTYDTIHFDTQWIYFAPNMMTAKTPKTSAVLKRQTRLDIETKECNICTQGWNGRDRSGSPRVNIVTMKCSHSYHDALACWHACSGTVKKAKVSPFFYLLSLHDSTLNCLLHTWIHMHTARNSAALYADINNSESKAMFGNVLLHQLDGVGRMHLKISSL